MEDIRGFISSEMRLPKPHSNKKKRYVTFQCHKCGAITEKRYTKSLFVDECTPCVQGRFTTEDFINICAPLFNGKYTYANTVYHGSKEQITITCPIHGDYTQRAREHMDGHGCNTCKFEAKKVNQTLSLDVWGERLKKHPHISFKQTPTELGYHSRADFTCDFHGDFNSQIGAIDSTQFLCSKCAGQDHQIQSVRTEHIGKTATLYYVYLPDIDMYKFGITLNLDKRLKALGSTELLATYEREYTEACKLEHMVFKKLDKYRYKGTTHLVKNGSTELFKQDVMKQIHRALRE